MKYGFLRKITRLMLCVGVLTSCDHFNSENVSDGLSEMDSFLIYGVTNTPYAALVRNIRSTVEPLPDTDTSDDYALERWSFTAEVLETFRGVAAETILYTVDAEKGESPNFGDAPFIVLLCRSADGFYWPGVGFNFPAGEREKTIAQSAGRKAVKAQKAFAECDD